MKDTAQILQTLCCVFVLSFGVSAAPLEPNPDSGGLSDYYYDDEYVYGENDPTESLQDTQPTRNSNQTVIERLVGSEEQVMHQVYSTVTGNFLGITRSGSVRANLRRGKYNFFKL